ncbi:P-loop NTPase family protein [Campylobacter curvus]|uniref:PhoH family protein n=2 Tax=Campylobacter TaxID=194 RepID=UPI0003642128|nr:PhoH family protein [Campylobacter curvus]QKF62154.1 ATP-binding protein (AAA domain) [Campylobacter curvus]UEB50442.1 PhoH family protein [Campylobacter curvus]
MSKINQIEQELSQIDASKFHKLINTYLSKKFSFMVHSNGTKIGEDKPISGTPDSFVALEDGNYIFVECTTQKSDIVSKFLKDLEKCFDEAKTGIGISKIKKVILACNCDIKPNELEILQKYCNSKDKLFFIGISSLANDLYANYSKIVYDFLGVSVDTVQILDESDFVAEYESGGYATPLNTVLCCRDKEVANIELALKDSQITFITGKAGVGKTRLAIEVAPKFAKENGYKFKAIFNRGVNIYDDLMAYFKVEDEKFLIFIDDVNRIHQALGYLFNSFNKKITNSQIKIVATVRDYAKDIIEKVPSNISCSVIEIQSMDNISVSEIISKNFKNIDPIHNEKILEISQNNPRMAFMACKIAQNGSFDAVNNTYDLYKEYFKSADNDINIFGDIDIGKIVAIVAFFRVIDRQNDKQVEVIKQAFEVDIVAIWDKIEKLHKYEIFDMYENSVIKVSDQILATYLFYKTVFVDKSLKISSFIVNFFPNHLGKTRDVLNQIMPVFDIDLILKELKDPIDRLWIKYSDKLLLTACDNNPIIEFIEIFWYLKESEILEKLHEEIQDLEQEHIDVNSIDIFKNGDNKSNLVLKILSLLSRSNDESNLKITIELIVAYLNKKPNKIHEVIYTLVKDFGYELNSYRYGYKKENIVMDRLWELSKNSDTLLLKRLFIRIASEMLGADFQDIRHHGRTLNLYNYTLVPTQALNDFRKTIFERLDEIFKNNYFLADLEKFINTYYRKPNISNSIEIIEQDKKYIVDLVVKYFNPKIYKHCKIVRKFLSFLDENKISYDKNAQTLFKNSYFDIDDLLCASPYKFKGNDIEQNKAYIKNELEKISNNNKTKDRWLELLNICVEIYNVIDDSDTYSFKNNFSILLEILSSNDLQLFIEVLGEYFKLGDPFLLYLDRRILIKILGKNGAFEFIEKQNFKAKDFWRFGIFTAIDENDITQTDVKNLLDLYKSADITNIPQYSDHLQKYENIKKDITLKILKVLCNRAISNNKFLITIEMFFYRFTSMLDKYIKTDKKLIETAYFMRLKDNINFDHDANILNKFLNYDSDFINRYIVNILKTLSNGVSSVNMHTDFSILFDRKDCNTVFLKIIETIHKIPDKKFVFGKGEFLKSFFMGFHSPLLDAQKTINIIEQFIDKYFTDKERMIFISRLICEFNSDESENANIDTRAHLYAYIISKNNDYELFESLKFEKNLRMSHGSWVPVIQRDIKFYEKLISMMNTANLLKHRTFINKIIDDLKRRIDREKKFDFMEDERFYRY